MNSPIVLIFFCPTPGGSSPMRQRFCLGTTVAATALLHSLPSSGANSLAWALSSHDNGKRLLGILDLLFVPPDLPMGQR